MQPFFKQYFTI